MIFRCILRIIKHKCKTKNKPLNFTLNWHIAIFKTRLGTELLPYYLVEIGPCSSLVGTRGLRHQVRNSWYTHGALSKNALMNTWSSVICVYLLVCKCINGSFKIDLQCLLPFKSQEHLSRRRHLRDE